MRDLTKSFFSFSWAMSLLGLEQMTNVLSPDRSGNRQERMSRTFDAVTGATEKQLGERTRKLYDAGNELQREMVDLAFDVVRVDNLRPDKVLERAAEMAESAADSLRDRGKEKPSGGAADSSRGRGKKKPAVEPSASPA